MVKLCVKCGADGHTNRTCKQPVTSFGLIVFVPASINFKKGRIYEHQDAECSIHAPSAHHFESKQARSGEILYLLVERKDTVGFLNIVQGSYPEAEPYKNRKLSRYFAELTCEERTKLKDWTFEDLWQVAGSDKKDISKAKKKFDNLNMQELLDTHPCLHVEADYLMPKGRLKYGESTKQCALREFSEETGYQRNCVTLLDAQPFVEQFTGTDNKAYRNVFYLARLKNTARISIRLGDDPNQSKEVRNLGWFNLHESLALLRDYHQDKKDILMRAQNVIESTLAQFPGLQSYRSFSGIVTEGTNPLMTGRYCSTKSSQAYPKRRDNRWNPYTERRMSNVASVQ